MPNISIGSGGGGTIVSGGSSGGSLGATYSASLPTYLSGDTTTLQTDNQGRLIVAPFSLIFSAPLQTYSSQGVGAHTSITAITPAAVGVSIGVLPSGASGIRVHLPPGANISYYVAAAVAANSAAAVAISVARNNASGNTDALVFDVPLNGMLMFVTNATAGTSGTYISGQPIYRFY